MRYRPHWSRIIILAATLHVIFFAAISKFWLPEKISSENLPAVEWIDAEISDAPAPAEESVQPDETFAAIELPPLEIPKIEFPPPPEISPQKFSPAPVQKIEEKPPEVAPPAEKISDEKNKLKVRVKVLPKDLISQLVESGAMPQGIPLNFDKIILSLTIGTDGKTKNIEIVRGVNSMINLIARSAASAWVFEPFLDEEGNAVEIKTELEFTAADF